MKLWTGTSAQRVLGFAACFALIATFSMARFADPTSLPRIASAGTLMALMRERSPGARTAGDLAGGKLAMSKRPAQRAAARSLLPEVLGSNQLPLGGGEIPDIYAPALPFSILPLDMAALAPPVGAIPPGGFFIAPPPGGGFIGAPPPGGGIGPPGGGGPPPGVGPPPIGEPPPPMPPPPVAVIPEPATWLQMIVGFGVIGLLLRRRVRPVAGRAG